VTRRKTYLLRLDPEVFAALQVWAQDELRSVNGQLEFTIRRALQQAGRLPRVPVREAEPVRRRPGG
jgi:hypothetical protein